MIAFPDGFAAGSFGPDFASQLLTLTAGLVSLLALLPAKLQRLLLLHAPLYLVLMRLPGLWDLSGMSAD